MTAQSRKHSQNTEPNASPSVARKRLLATIYVAKRDMAMGEDAYRAMTLRVTGNASLKEADQQALLKVITDMKAKGWKPQVKGWKPSNKGWKSQPAKGAASKGTFRKASPRPEIRKLWVAAREVRDVGGFSFADTGEGDWRKAFAAWVKRQTGGETGVDNPEWLTADQTRQLIEQLKQWKARLIKLCHDGTINRDAW